MGRKIERFITPAAKDTLPSADVAALYQLAEDSPRKDIVRIGVQGSGAYCKRDRHATDHHTLTICLDDED